MQSLEIKLVSDSEREQATRRQLERLLLAYDLEPWIRTRTVLIEERAIPHSHPVLTLNTRHIQNDDLLLSTFLHEQLHWSVLENKAGLSRAIQEVRDWLPDVPVGHPIGADDADGSYLHVIVNYLEWIALEQVVGRDRARAAMDFWPSDHYTALYAIVIAHRERLADIVERHGL
jgi:hypothetical protein